MSKSRNDVHNFNAGPAALPESALVRAQAELVNFKGNGLSLMEASHRSKVYEDVHHHAKSLLKGLLDVPDTHDILFLQGGASLQFAMLPMNFIKEGAPGAYLMTGSWASKALSEAKLVGPTRVAGTAEPYQFHRTPSQADMTIEPTDAYLHLTSNETIGGVQWPTFPDAGNVPLVADMSSDILSRTISVDRFSMIYAGAQKNLGPSGVTVVIVKKSWLDLENSSTPTILRYSTHLKNDSLYNTPPTFAIYLLSLVLEWVQEHGGVERVAKVNEGKANLIYNTIDESDGYYVPYVDKAFRSRMNITFGLRTPALEEQFLSEAKGAGFVGLNGHRSVGGCRASTYNAVPVESCERLVEFMHDFKRRNG